MTFIFSSDAHVVEPKEIFDKGLPESLKKHGIRSERQGEHMCVLAGEKVLHRMRIVPRQVAAPPTDEPAPLGGQVGANEEVVRLHATPKGASDLKGRLEDMVDEGVDAEIVFPSTCLWTYGIEHPETELATAQIYNDWNDQYFQGHLDKFVRCGVLPVRDFNNTANEMKRLAKKGFTSAMIPCVTAPNMPKYNDESWDPVFELAGDLGIVLVMHSGTGLETVQPERRAGGAVINYTNQACDAWNAIQYLVAGGMLDRHPKAKVAVIECGASWLAGLVERMDEIYVAHAPVVRPKLSMMPSEIVERQVAAGFQNDRACILSRSVTGVKPLLWGSDYPHAEGTFPRSKQVIERLFKGIDISEQDKADILGGNAGRLFRLHRPEFQVAA
jgi:predicted TIM-barrel fold metal-dependent hydrolase